MTLAVVGTAISKGNTDGRHIVESAGLSIQKWTVDTVESITPGSINASGSVGEKDVGFAEFRNRGLDEHCFVGSKASRHCFRAHS